MCTSKALMYALQETCKGAFKLTLNALCCNICSYNGIAAGIGNVLGCPVNFQE